MVEVVVLMFLLILVWLGCVVIEELLLVKWIISVFVRGMFFKVELFKI